MEKEYIEKLHILPAHMREGVRRWIELGPASCPGGFLSAVIRGDLFDALGRADSENMYALPAYGVYFYNYAPAGSYGSPEAFANWKGLRNATR